MPELTSIMAFIPLSTVQTKTRFQILTIKSNLHILRGTRHITFKLNQPPSRLFYVLSSFTRLVFYKESPAWLQFTSIPNRNSGVRMDVVLSKYAKIRLFQAILACITIKLTRIRLNTLDMSHEQSYASLRLLFGGFFKTIYSQWILF